MEGVPESKKETTQELDFDKAVSLAEELFRVAEARNQFAHDQGGGDFEGFATMGQHVGNNRLTYDELEAEFSKLRKKFDDEVKDKMRLVEQLRKIGDKELADKIARTFNVRTGLIGRMFPGDK